jgi:hypothetical protein
VDRVSNSVGQKLLQRPFGWFLLACLVFLYLNLFILPSTPVFLGGDGGTYLLNARRMLDGAVLYRDFFQFTPPGTESVYLTLFRLFGVRAWIPNAALVVLGLGLALLALIISRRLMQGWAAFLPSLLFLTVAFSRGLDATHHWFSSAAVVAAIALVVEKRTPRRLLGGGALCGLASWFTQGRGVVAVLGLAVFLLWERRWRKERWSWLLKAVSSLVAAFVITLLVTNAYFAWRAGLPRFLDCLVIFGVKYYSADLKWNSLQVYMTELPQFQPWYRAPTLAVWLFINVSLPLIYAFFFFRYRRTARAQPLLPWDRLMVLNLVGLFLLMGVAPAPARLRLCAVSLPAFVLLGWLLSLPGRLNRVLRPLVCALALILALAEPLERQAHWRASLAAPTGRLAFLDPQVYDKFEWVAAHTHPGDFIFEAAGTDLYFPLGLRNPTEVPYVTSSGYTRPEQVRDGIDGLDEHRVRFVLWSLSLDLDSRGETSGDHLAPLRAYVRSHYRVEKTFDNFDQVWERQGLAPDERPQAPRS